MHNLSQFMTGMVVLLIVGKELIANKIKDQVCYLDVYISQILRFLSSLLSTVTDQ
jgi:hypothetical protein